MTRTEQQAHDLLLALSPDARRRVIASVQEESKSAPDENFEAAWDPIIARRIDEIISGKVEGIPHSEVMHRLRQQVADAKA